jgi:protein-tyrosine phosphatase
VSETQNRLGENRMAFPKTEPHWIPAPAAGRLAILPRPRGGDWLSDEIGAWRRAGVDVVVSLLTPDEAADLELNGEAAACREQGIEFVSFPVPDRGLPASRPAMTDLVTRLAERVADGKTVAAHCRQGVGRAALAAVCVLIALGEDAEAAVRAVGAARGCPVPETPEQRRWVAEFAPRTVNVP